HFFDSRKNETRPQFLRRFNESLLQNFSVRATTIPSGHVAGPLAAALSAWMIAPEYGPWLLAGAAVITAATVLGRYHYAIDAVLGALVGVLPPAIRAFWF
ncbi:MAG: phosphatase PAP2 family protein, partial [Vicinamibacterales bacterium]